MYQAVASRQHTEGEDISYPYRIIGQDISCDLCGKNGGGELYKTDKFVYLCPFCFKHLDSSGGKIRQCVERWLEGNVI
ncbi:hypothetical protein QUF80_22045 [Desulfococcaceae bacterium HSG8]|nr:hypothetical protein [Desulfococcaceae bacterium HSG8]